MRLKLNYVIKTYIYDMISAYLYAIDIVKPSSVPTALKTGTGKVLLVDGISGR